MEKLEGERLHTVLISQIVQSDLSEESSDNMICSVRGMSEGTKLRVLDALLLRSDKKATQH